MSLTKVSYSLITGAPANILDYGADATGTADSSTAITLALASSDAVFIPKGTFLITSNITIPRANITLFGDGDSSVISYSGNNRRIICNQDNFTTATSQTLVGKLQTTMILVCVLVMELRLVSMALKC